MGLFPTFYPNVSSTSRNKERTHKSEEGSIQRNQWLPLPLLPQCKELAAALIMLPRNSSHRPELHSLMEQSRQPLWSLWTLKAEKILTLLKNKRSLLYKLKVQGRPRTLAERGMDTQSSVPKFFDERWKNGTWDLNMFVKDGKMDWDAVIVAGRAAMVGFFAAYFVDALTGLDVVGQTGNFICKAGLFMTVIGIILFRKTQDFEKLQKLVDEATFYDKQWRASWQDQDQDASTGSSGQGGKKI
ncbi:hypothetical protein F0562_026433 [Nyssa sinensis]|uniref:Uncharacterized protein n=1 Tax=Nyssa sinensis TaxID=561372 RepID=A0A5J5BF05_9ASTE|nr:hypothetical protein F0562_026433 [Nyssa sinensis]